MSTGSKANPLPAKKLEASKISLQRRANAPAALIVTSKASKKAPSIPFNVTAPRSGACRCLSRRGLKRPPSWRGTP